MPDTFARSEVDGARLIWLLDLTYAGEVLRLSTEAVQVSSDDGSIQYIAAISGAGWRDEMAGFSTSAPEPSVSLSIVMPPGYSWAAKVAAGHILGMATGELSQIRDGDPWESRVRLLSGRIDAPVYGGDGEPMECSLIASAYDDTSTLIPTTAVVGAATFPVHHEGHAGKTYPTVIGQPYSHGRTGSKTGTTPGWIVNTTNRWLLVAGHRVDATQVWVRDLTSSVTVPYWEALTIVHTQDLLSRTFAYVVLPNDVTKPSHYNVDGRYMCSWDAGGGMQNRRRTGPLEGAGDVIEWALGQSTLDIDRGRMAAASDQLNAFKIAGFIDDPEVTAWEWVRANLLPILPVEIRRGPDGLYPIVHRWTATADDAIEDLDAQRDGIERDGGAEYNSSRNGEVANEIRVSYSYDNDTNDYYATAVVHGDPLLGSGADLYRSSHCRRSRLQSATDQPMVYSERADLVYDPATAARIAHWLAASKAIPSRLITYSAPIRLMYLHPGDVVTITDTDLSLVAQLCLVRGVTMEDGPTIRLRLETIER